MKIVNPVQPVESCIILLHNLADNEASLEEHVQTLKGKQPESAFILLRGLQPIEPGNSGYHWADANGTVDEGFINTSRVILGDIIQDGLMARCGFQPRDIVVLGHGQGGMAALAAIACWNCIEFGGVVSFGGPMPKYVQLPLNVKAKTPALIYGVARGDITPTVLRQIRKVFSFTNHHIPASEHDTVPLSDEEMAPLLEFFAHRLRREDGRRQTVISLGKELRRMAYPDTFKAISHVIVNAHALSRHKGTATFQVRWSIRDYVEKELTYDPSLLGRDHLFHAVLTVTGTASKAYANSAAEYVRWRWPQAKVDLLDLVASMLGGQSTDDLENHVGSSGHDSSRVSRKTPVHIEPASFSVRLEMDVLEDMPESGWISVYVKGSLNELVETAQQLAWLSAIFRVPRYGQVSYSEVTCEQKADMVFSIYPLELKEIREKDGVCWLPLFINGIVARGFPIPSRNEEKGIEIPFNIMISLAKIMYSMTYLDGLYLKGFSNLLFPTKISHDSASVQWHSIAGANPKARLPPGSLPPTNGENAWVKSNNLKELASAKRTFLGYCRLVDLHLDTQNSHNSLKATTYSQAGDEKPALGLTPKSVITGTSGMGIWGFQMNIDMVLPKGLFHTADQGWYPDMLDTAKETPVIVYDNDKTSKRAWLVPTLGVALHMAHIWARDKDDVSPLPYAAVQWDSGQAAYAAIKEHSKDRVREELGDDKSYCLRDLISRLLVSLDKLLEVEAQANREPGRAVSLERSKLYGWELLDIAQGKHVMRRKQLTVNQDWKLLAADTLVLFCQDFGEIVRPAADVNLCAIANPIYHKQDQLIATVKCVQRLSEENGRPKDNACLRLADQAYWLSPGEDLFKDCTHCLHPTHGKSRPCTKQVQRLLMKDASTKALKPPPIEGAISFGTRKLLKSGPTALQELPLCQSLSSGIPDVGSSINGEHESSASTDGTQQRQAPRRRRQNRKRLFELIGITTG